MAERVGRPSYRLVYQSRSGAPGQPWLGPDVLEYLRELAAAGDTRDVVLAPIGFISDHMEVVYDLDTEARQLCDELGLHMVRAETVGADPRFAAMIRELVLERMGARPAPRAGRAGSQPRRLRRGLLPRPQDGAAALSRPFRAAPYRTPATQPIELLYGFCNPRKRGPNQRPNRWPARMRRNFGKALLRSRLSRLSRLGEVAWKDPSISKVG